MPNAWLNHVRQLRKNNRNMSYKQLLSHAKNSYGGANQNQMNQQSQQGGEENKPVASSMGAAMNMIRSMTQGGGVTGFESRSSLTRSATTLGGRRRNSRKTRRRRR
jgi:hypothetical protein